MLVIAFSLSNTVFIYSCFLVVEQNKHLFLIKKMAEDESVWKTRDDLIAKHPLHESETESNQVSIIYNADYNISAYGIEKLHVFDTRKWGKIADYLSDYFKVG